jgi:hypothetical protein
MRTTITLTTSRQGRDPFDVDRRGRDGCTAFTAAVGVGWV